LLIGGGGGYVTNDAIVDGESGGGVWQEVVA
jgi:hypothetical protein